MIRFRVCDSFTLSFIRTWFELIDDYQFFTKTRFLPPSQSSPEFTKSLFPDSITVQRGSATSQGSCASDRIGAICRKVLQLRHRGRVDAREFRRDGDAFL